MRQLKWFIDQAVAAAQEAMEAEAVSSLFVNFCLVGVGVGGVWGVWVVVIFEIFLEVFVKFVRVTNWTASIIYQVEYDELWLPT